MALWGNVDQANNSPKSAPAQIRLTPNTANQTALFGNNTTTGVFAVDVTEAQVAEGSITHPGWVIRTVGSGGRAGRVFTETLVAMGTITGDASDDATLPDVLLAFTAQPANSTIVGANSATFAVTATATPSAVISYQWAANTGSGFANLTEAGVYSNVTTATLSISAGTGLTGNQYRCIISAPAANTKTSKAAVLTVN